MWGCLNEIHRTDAYWYNHACPALCAFHAEEQMTESVVTGSPPLTCIGMSPALNLAQVSQMILFVFFFFVFSRSLQASMEVVA
jgi:hypothetical protein